MGRMLTKEGNRWHMTGGRLVLQAARGTVVVFQEHCLHEVLLTGLRLVVCRLWSGRHLLQPQIKISRQLPLNAHDWSCEIAASVPLHLCCCSSTIVLNLLLLLLVQVLWQLNATSMVTVGLIAEAENNCQTCRTRMERAHNMFQWVGVSIWWRAALKLHGALIFNASGTIRFYIIIQSYVHTKPFGKMLQCMIKLFDNVDMWTVCSYLWPNIMRYSFKPK